MCLLPVLSRTANAATASSVQILCAGLSGIQVLSPEGRIIFGSDN